MFKDSKIFDKDKNRLIMFREATSVDFWVEHWRTNRLKERIESGCNNRFIKRYTKRFLKPNARILEGGCGLGQIVYALSSWGFDAYGVDFAKETIEKVKEEFPALKISVQDVRSLNYPDNFFDGYWSLGVIEHFYDGYAKIINEARRVIRPGGFLLLTFPYLSPLRKIKIWLKFYKNYNKVLDERTEDFYQFILDELKVKEDIESIGFKLVLKKSFDATKGIADELGGFGILFKKIYSSQNSLAKGLRFLNSLLFSRLACHVILLVFRKI